MTTKSFKVGVLGSGEVAKTLASGFLKHGHQVMVGSREPAKLNAWKSEHAEGRTGSFAETAAFGEVIVLAVKGTVAMAALRMVGEENLKGKTVIDAVNPIADTPPVNGILSFFTPPNEALMERMQMEFPEAHFVKAFNSVGAPHMINPQFEGGPPTMFICGNDSGAKAIVTGMLDQFGWETEDMGSAVSARAIEPLCQLWCARGFLNNQWSHAFKLLKK